MKRELITPPLLTPVTLAEAKTNLYIEHSDDDAIITRCIAAATEYAERYTERHLMVQTWRYHFDCFANPLLFESVPAVSVSDVSYFDGSNVQQLLVENTDFYAVLLGLTPALVAIGGHWPSTYKRPNAVSFDVVSGYGSAALVPDGIKTAIHLLTGHLYENREQSAAIQLNTIPFGVHSFLDQYRIIDL